MTPEEHMQDTARLTKLASAMADHLNPMVRELVLQHAKAGQLRALAAMTLAQAMTMAAAIASLQVAAEVTDNAELSEAAKEATSALGKLYDGMLPDLVDNCRQRITRQMMAQGHVHQ